MDYREYWSEVESIVDYVAESVIEHGCDVYDTLHECLDSHEFVIYTAKARMVITLTDNPDYFRDEGFELSDDMFDEQRAYWAMYGDVTNHRKWDESTWEDEHERRQEV